jgi:hypothetical protein
MLGWVLLAACTLWLAIQNTILIAVVVASPPQPLVSAAGALVKVGGHVLARLWPTAAALLTLVLALALLFRHRDQKPAAHGGES